MKCRASSLISKNLNPKKLPSSWHTLYLNQNPSTKCRAFWLNMKQSPKNKPSNSKKKTKQKDESENTTW